MTIIGSQYDPEKAMRSRAYAYECWYNVHYEDNTIGVTDEQLKDFDEKWDVWYSVWTKDAEVDSNEYEISDEDWDLAELEGEEEAKETSGHDGKTWKDISVTAGNSTFSVASGAAAGGAIAAGVAATKAAATAATAAQSAAIAAQTANAAAGIATAANTTQVASIAFGNTANMTQASLNAAQASASAANATSNATNAATNAVKTANAASNASKAATAICYVGCAMSLAVGTLYEVLRPNKDSYEALMQLNEMLKQAHSDIDFDKAQLDAMSEVITQEATGAEDEQAAKQKELEQKALLLFAATMFREEIRARMEAGEEVSPEDIKRYEDTEPLLGQLQAEVEALKADLGVSKEEITESIAGKQEEYNAIAERIANTVGMTDFIAQFDQTTRNLCITEAAMQSLNIVSGTVSAAQAAATGPWGWAFAAMGLAGAGMSLHGVIEQSRMASDLKGIVDLRVDTQAKVENTTSVYYSALDKYAVDMEVVSNVDLDIEEESTAISEELSKTTPVVETSGEDSNPFTIGTAGENTNPFTVNITDKPEEDTKKNPFI